MKFFDCIEKVMIQLLMYIYLYSVLKNTIIKLMLITAQQLGRE